MTPLSDNPDTHTVSWPVLFQRIAIGVAGAMVIGAGGMVVSDNTKVQLHEQRLNRLEVSLEKVPDIDKNVLILGGKVDVLNQKLDDARILRTEQLK